MISGSFVGYISIIQLSFQKYSIVQLIILTFNIKLIWPTNDQIFNKVFLKKFYIDNACKFISIIITKFEGWGIRSERCLWNVVVVEQGIEGKNWLMFPSSKLIVYNENNIYIYWIEINNLRHLLC